MRHFTVRWFFALAFVSIATCGPVAAASNCAPADEYFGRYHLSILGIRNAIGDMTIKAHEQPERARAFLNSAELTEDAIHQWQNRYPQDSWLPKTIFSLERLYVTIGTPKSAEHAVNTAAWLNRSFPDTQFAQMGREELASLTSSDDGTATTPDSPAELGMVPALSDTTIPPSDDTQMSVPTPQTLSAVSQGMASDQAAPADQSAAASTDANAQGYNASYDPDSGSMNVVPKPSSDHSVDITVQP